LNYFAAAQTSLSVERYSHGGGKLSFLAAGILPQFRGHKPAIKPSATPIFRVSGQFCSLSQNKLV
jgi:hypothetical protein